MITLRPYQREAVEAVYRHLREHDDNPCVVIPTAGGKTPVMATICKDAVGLWKGRVLVVAHVKELLEQALDKIRQVAPELMLEVGVYSAGLGSRDTDHPIIVAGVQSAYRRAGELGRFDLAIIDETHMIPPDGEGMYRTLLAGLKETNPELRIIGLTATPFRMTSGPICAPENVLNTVCFEIGVRELIVEGFLCPLKSKAGSEKVDMSNLHIRGGEFIAGEVENLMDEERLVEAACEEIVSKSNDRKAVLVFASGIRHGNHVAGKLRDLGQSVGTVFGDTLDFERDRTLADFRAGRLKYLVNVNVLTTGFDAPSIDCVAMLRPTMSPGLYYQMVGRGFRLHPGKTDCLVLDFGGNVLRHGPVDAIQVRNGVKGVGTAPAKECPQCASVIAAGYEACPDCGYVFPEAEGRRRARHAASASDVGILSGEVKAANYPVESVHYSVHTKRGASENAPRSMRVEYRLGCNHYQSEWICFEHTGFARERAIRWWRHRSKTPVPPTAEEAVRYAEGGAVCRTKSITIRTVPGEDFPRIVGYVLDDKPDRLEPCHVGPADEVTQESFSSSLDEDLPF